MLLTKLIEGLKLIAVKGKTDINIKGIAYDSRKVRPGFVFVCIDGSVTDGHKYIPQALENGAVALLTQKEVDVPGDITTIQVENTRYSLAYISDRFYRHPSGKLNLIGITGTKGKTTTVYMLKSILEAYGQKAGIIGTLGTKIGDRSLYSERTTPESLDLQSIFDEMLAENIKNVAMEVSSQGLKLHRVSCSEFDIGVFTNFSEDHIGPNEHSSMEDYLAAKIMLFKICKRGLVNIDSLVAERVISEANCPILTFGIDKKADIMAKNIKTYPQKVEFVLISPWFNGDIEVNIPGRFSVYNALSAIGVSGMLGLPFDIIKKGLSKVSVPGRAELVDVNKEYTVIIDYAHSPDSLENILKAVKEYTSGKLISLFGCGGDRDRGKRPKMGEISGQMADITIITSDNPRTEDPEEIVKEIETGIKQTDGKYVCIVDRREAIEYALGIAQAGDTVLLAGKGHETYQTFKDSTIHFDEREIVKEILEKS
jgi:UDP-N-acetylmuramoyl-L-alanyl-D-glutamate--2,6-diaminopimelate ligase